MVKQELIERSPVRIFEKSIQGGLKAGEIGVIASPSGVGKTSVLVQIALDKLLQAQKVIHVSFTQHNAYVLAWYENIFEEFTKEQPIENLTDVKDDLVKNRVVMHFNQTSMTVDQVLRSLKALIDGADFKAQTIIVDGFDFTQIDGEYLSKVKDFAKELNLCVWYSCNVQESADKIPSSLKNYLDLLEVVIVLEPKTDYVSLSVCKNRETSSSDSSLRLDPRTLLILQS